MGLWRIQIATRPSLPDPAGQAVRQLLADFQIHGIGSVRSSRIFLIELPAPPATPDCPQDEPATVHRIARELLSDSVAETFQVSRAGEPIVNPPDVFVAEAYFKPGVMDNVANSTRLALADMGIQTVSIRTGRRYEIRPEPSPEHVGRIARLLGNDCIEEVVVGTKPIEPPPRPPISGFKLRHVRLCDLDDAALQSLSRQAHLFLSLAEMRTIQDDYKRLGREPTDLELETLAQTWSEHCVHKTLRAAIEYEGAPFPPRRGDAGADGRSDGESNGQSDGASDGNSVAALRPCTYRYDNLLKDTIAQATTELIKEGRGPTCLSVFKDNAGIIALDDRYGIAFKVETHNHPSAIEPYGGSATGIGGVIRDVLGCGLGAKPIANTDVFCVAPPDWPIESVPKGVIHPKSVLKGIVAGVRDYGNRMGIPTINGAVHFDPRYLGNPLVYCGCVGLIPRDKIEKAAQPGDWVVLIGGRTGRDGIHGATFSSAELTDTHEDEFAHAVQIGNAIEEKKILDVVLQARDHAEGCLYSAITDCGAGGLSSAVGEMGADIGAEVDLEKAPLKYDGLRYDEIWISEAQERMVLAVPPRNLAAFLSLAASEDVEASVIGRFTDSGRMIVRYDGREVGNLEMRFLHDGVPKITRRAEWRHAASDATASRRRYSPPRPTEGDPGLAAPPSDDGPGIGRPDAAGCPRDLVAKLLRRLGDLTTASKHWIIRQYDHEVQAGSVVKPLVGPCDGPSDAAVVRPRLDGPRGIAIGCGLAPELADVDPYWMAAAAIDEALRNVVCVGGDPRRTALLDNFCWPKADDARNLGALVRACQACYDVAVAYGTPFISGKDSLNNEFALNEADAADLADLLASRYGRTDVAETLRRNGGRLAVPWTLLISAVSLIDDVHRCITALPRLRTPACDAVAPKSGSGPCAGDPAASRVQAVGRAGPVDLFFAGTPTGDWNAVSLSSLARLHAAVADLIQHGIIAAAHDCSEGGPAVTVAEMAIAGDLHAAFFVSDEPPLRDPFATPVSAYVVQAPDVESLRTVAEIPGIVVRRAARVWKSADPATFTFDVSAAQSGAATTSQARAASTDAASATSAQQAPTVTAMPPAIDPSSPSVPLSELRRAWRTPLDW